MANIVIMKIHLPHVSVQFCGEIARTKGEFIKASARGNNDKDGDTGKRLHARQAESEYHHHIYLTPSPTSSPKPHLVNPRKISHALAKLHTLNFRYILNFLM